MKNKFYKFKKNISPFKTAVVTVFISVSASVLISILSDTGKNFINDEMSYMGLNGLAAVAYNSSGENMTNNEFYQEISSLENIQYATPVITENVTVSFSNKKKINSICWGIAPDACEVVSLEIVSGRMINNTDVENNAFVCLVDENIAQLMYNRSDICGKTITIPLKNKELSFTVIGTIKKGSSILNSLTGGVVPDFIYIPYTTMTNLSSKSTFDQIILTGQSSDTIKDQLTETITKHTGKLKKHNIILTDLSQQKQQISNIADTAFISLFLVSCVSVIVCSMSVGASVNTAVISRQKDIGIKMSMGASCFDIIMEFMFSALMSCLIGIAAALTTIIVIISVVSGFIGIHFSVDYSLILFSISATIMLTTIFSFVPSYNAAKLPPIKALNRE